jgi:hypothetical protein
MKTINKMTRAELAAYVQSHLQIKRISVILSVGVAVAIYTKNKYASADRLKIGRLPRGLLVDNYFP